VVWLQRNLQTDLYQGIHRQSQNGGLTFSTPTIVFACEDNSDLLNNIVTVSSWQGENEVVWVGATVDRLGSIPEFAQLYRWSDESDAWESITIDSSSYPQTGLSIAAHESVLIAAYSRRINAASQREIYFTYSLDGGTAFAEATALTSSADDDFDPRVVICPELNRFAVFYQSGGVLEEPSTIWMREGDLSAPWLLSEPIRISEIDQALRSGGYDVSAGSGGFAVAWSGPGYLGDSDIWFDAGWLGEAAPQPHSFVSNAFRMGAPYPNPFNSMLTIPLVLDHDENVVLEVLDILGREVMTQSFGSLSRGEHRLTLDFTGISSGAYFLRPHITPHRIARIQLVK
jgi:hypothetical protein